MDFDFTLEVITPDLSTLLTIGGSGALQLPSGIQSLRPGTVVAGAMRWNTTVPQLEYYNGTAWISAGGSVTSVTLATGTTGLTVNAATTATITSSGTFIIAGTLATGSGGTGLTTTGTANQFLGVNVGGTALEYKTIIGSGGIVVTPSAGSFTISSTTGVAPTNVIYVAKYGNDTTGNGSFDLPFLTVKKGTTVASGLANSLNVVSVIILDGVYLEINPITLSNEYVIVQGQYDHAVFVQPSVNGQPLFDLSSGTTTAGPFLGNMILEGVTNGGTPYKNVAGGILVKISGNGYFINDQINLKNGFIGVETGNGTITTSQSTEWLNSTADNNTTTLSAKASSLLCSAVTIRGSTTAVSATNAAVITLSGFQLEGNLAAPTGTGFSVTNTATILAASGIIRGFTAGLLAAGTSNTRILSSLFVGNTADFNQSTSTAIVQIAGVYSKINPIITNGSNVSLNYIDINTNDYIVGSAVLTGVPGKEFRVRNYDGRIAIGDNATNANIASGGAGGSRTLNLIDTNGNARIWRYTTDAATDPSIEIIKGVNPANEDGAGDAPITSITAATDTILVDVSGVDYNDPLATPPGIDRTTLASSAFPAGRIFQVNGTASNNGTFTVLSSTYNSGTQTISVVVTANITISEGAVGTAVFGGGAGRTDGPNPNNPAAAVAAGTGNVWWDLFLQESDYLVVRRRTGGGGSLPDEKARIYSDRSEWLGASTYNDSDNALILVAQHTANAVNYLTFRNSITTAPTLISATGADADIGISLIPKGLGVITAGGTNSLIAPTGTTAQRPVTPVNGAMRYNSTTTLIEFRQNGVWVNLSAGTGTVTSVSGSGGTTGLTLSGGPITTAGTLTLGGTLAVANGGTGLVSTPTNGQLDIGNGTGFTRSTLTAGTGISVTNGAGTITLANIGVTSVAGTANQITASAATGAITLSTPAAFIAPGSVQVTTTLLQTTSAALTAAGTTQATATLAPSRYNIVTTVAAGTGVILPLPVTPFGNEVYVANRGANPLNIYPNTGAIIVNAAANAPVVLPVGQEATFVCTTTAQWWTTESILTAGANITLTPSAGSLTIASTGGAATPGGATTNVQFNNAGVFGGTSNFNYLAGTNPQVNILGTLATTQLVIGSATPTNTNIQTGSNNASVYVEVPTDTTTEGLRVHFKRSTAGISGWITYDYDQNSPNIRMTDEDDDTPYIQFNTIGTGTYLLPQFTSLFGGRGPYAGRTTGFEWKIGTATADWGAATSVMMADSQFLTLPGGSFNGAAATGTTANRPAAPAAGMVRFNSTVAKTEEYTGTNWQLPGRVLQMVSGTIAATSGTTTVPLDNTIPTSTEGNQIWTATFTPLSTASRIVINFTITHASSIVSATNIMSVFAGATNIGATMCRTSATANTASNMALSVTYAPGSLTAITFSSRLGGSAAATTYCNQISTATLGGAAVTEYTITEIL